MVSTRKDRYVALPKVASTRPLCQAVKPDFHGYEMAKLSGDDIKGTWDKSICNSKEFQNSTFITKMISRLLGKKGRGVVFKRKQKQKKFFF